MMAAIMVLPGMAPPSAGEASPPSRGASPPDGGEAHGFLGGAEQGAGLGPGFLVFRLGVAIGHHAGAGLGIKNAILHQRGAQADSGIHAAITAKIAKAAGIDATARGLQLLDDFHRAEFWRTGERAGREAAGQRIQR